MGPNLAGLVGRRRRAPGDHVVDELPVEVRGGAAARVAEPVGRGMRPAPPAAAQAREPPGPPPGPAARPRRRGSPFAARPGDRAGRVWPDRAIRTAFENAVAAAGLGDLRFHDLRHHFASWFVMRGGQLQALKEILGHASLTMTMRYAHLVPGHLRAEVDKTAAAPPVDAAIAALGAASVSTRPAADDAGAASGPARGRGHVNGHLAGTIDASDA